MGSGASSPVVVAAAAMLSARLPSPLLPAPVPVAARPRVTRAAARPGARGPRQTKKGRGLSGPAPHDTGHHPSGSPVVPL